MLAPSLRQLKIMTAPETLTHIHHRGDEITDRAPQTTMLPLEKKHPHYRDKCISFEPLSHTYTVHRSEELTELVPISVTNFAKDYFKKFDAKATVDRYYERWKGDAESKYFQLIHSILDCGGDTDSAKRAIIDLWDANSAEASSNGTKMHADAELLCNGLPPTEESREMVFLRRWLQEFQPHMKWQPARTEWMLWYECERDDPISPILLAGTLDLLMWSETADAYGLFDFKRTNPKPKRAGGPQHTLGPHTHPLYHPGYAKAPLSQVEDSDFGKYTMQLNILSKMLRDRYAIDVGEHMYLLQLHPDLQAAHCVQVPMLEDATNTLFKVEEYKLRG